MLFLCIYYMLFSSCMQFFNCFLFFFFSLSFLFLLSLFIYLFLFLQAEYCCVHWLFCCLEPLCRHCHVGSVWINRQDSSISLCCSSCFCKILHTLQSSCLSSSEAQFSKYHCQRFHSSSTVVHRELFLCQDAADVQINFEHQLENI